MHDQTANVAEPERSKVAVIALIQRVTHASVTVETTTIGQINKGLLALIGVERGDGPAQVVRLAERLCGYRVFSDNEGKMNLSVLDIEGALLLVPQFTLVADTAKGMRPSFSSGAAPEVGEIVFDRLIEEVKGKGLVTQTGQFGADMQVSLVNDGPVTFWLQVPPT